ncbi:molybdopterin converting factor subunit 1 [Nitratireductor kimnyeongensis]|uniref:Molybdopterin converting factor subunit 1 n=1 Tax=Nitratireductor kimnyeongensis TaxID=430679 RepID=A0ABW0T3A4_9HYPH|nr:molybdopterin converting factor subunit 1 [Nitratireductor kimnyeongensis]QZZ35133.1 molybdopterin converting factor subunit 1 [Nitratireductor kimnyeongensis]
MKLVYFAWVRERIGLSDETVTLPADVKTVTDLLTWLKGRGENYEAAMERPEIIRVAINQEHADHSTPLPPHGEIALFPPMTGG